jgi:hypothetical protein
MDPITILAAASAVWNGIKKASDFAQAGFPWDVTWPEKP